MLIESVDRESYLLLRVKEDIGLNTDLSGLRPIVEEYLKEGKKNFAFSFTKNSYFYTRSIAVLITSSELIRDKGGSLYIITENDDIMEILSLIDFENSIHVFANENELTTAITNGELTK